MSDFIFITCQIGAERAVKYELARRHPDFRFAYSRPGFLTFKLPGGHKLPGDFDLQSVFARTHGFSLGAVSGQNYTELAAAAWKISKDKTVQRIHVWPKDRFEPGEHGYEPGFDDETLAAHRALLQTCPRTAQLAGSANDMLRPAKTGETVLDCVMLAPEKWWVGWHRVKSSASHFPGGMMSLELPDTAVSRAWLKMEEALRWSRLPIARGARVAELGSAPGGASQALLARGLEVIGIDPAEMSPVVLAEPHFTHLRYRSTQVPRRQLRKIRWLTADMNVPPNYTLQAVESIVSHRQINVRGLILTLKLVRWEMADEVPDYIERIRGWGYNQVQARQLQHNRREICVAALQHPFRRKPLCRKDEE
jgi:23S rRNA (cytidine2498-2'-O)-methyltransferase